MKNKFCLLIIPVLLSVSSCECVVNRLSFYPDKNFSVTRDRLPAAAEELFITTSDGVKIQAIHFRRKDKPGKLLIYFHGNAGNLYHRIDESVKLLNTGCDVLLVSYRGYGRSDGSPSENGIYMDGESALAYAMSNMGYNLNRISLYGRSLGTTVAVELAQDRDISSVVLITPISSGKDMAGFFSGKVFSSFAGSSFDSISKINNIRSPLLIIHGTDDEVVPYTQGQKLYEKFTGIKKMITIQGGRHNDLEFTDPDLYWKSIFEFMKNNNK